MGDPIRANISTVHWIMPGSSFTLVGTSENPLRGMDGCLGDPSGLAISVLSYPINQVFHSRLTKR